MKNVLNAYAKTVTLIRVQWNVGAGYIANLVTRAKKQKPDIDDTELAAWVEFCWKRDKAKIQTPGLFLTTVPDAIYEARRMTARARGARREKPTAAEQQRAQAEADALTRQMEEEQRERRENTTDCPRCKLHTLYKGKCNSAPCLKRAGKI